MVGKLLGAVVGLVALVMLASGLIALTQDTTDGTDEEADPGSSTTQASDPQTTPAQASADAEAAEERKAAAQQRAAAKRKVRRESSAIWTLSQLDVKGRAPMTGYDRDRFGPAWLDADRNGCDTRNDILNQYLTQKTWAPSTNKCKVLTGYLARGSYTNKAINFEQGSGTSIDIDHVVALGNSWATGSFKWGVRKRAGIANDPLNLLPVDYAANRQKSDGDAATWLPVKSYRCAYVARQIAVKHKYGLWVTTPEKQAMLRILEGSCPDQELPKDRSKQPKRVDHDISDPRPAKPSSPPQAAKPAGSGAKPGGTPIYYKNCTAVRAAGANPIRRGQPGYGSHLDRDGDGSACE